MPTFVFRGDGGDELVPRLVGSSSAQKKSLLLMLSFFGILLDRLLFCVWIVSLCAQQCVRSLRF